MLKLTASITFVGLLSMTFFFVIMKVTVTYKGLSILTTHIVSFQYDFFCGFKDDYNMERLHHTD